MLHQTPERHFVTEFFDNETAAAQAIEFVDAGRDLHRANARKDRDRLGLGA